MKQQDIIVPLCGICAFESGSIFKHLTPAEVETLNYSKRFPAV